MSQPLAERPAGVSPAQLPEPRAHDGVPALLPDVGPQPLVHQDRVDRTVGELLEAATQQVFSPDPLADPRAAALTHATAEPDRALAAARYAGVDVRPVDTHVDVRPVDTHVDVAAAVSTLDAVFAPGTGHHFYPPSLVRNLLAAGAPVLVAREREIAVGVLLAVPGWTADGRSIVQSGPMAVLPRARGRGVAVAVAVALKLAQRAWALQRGVPEIRWTFDAMAVVNAGLNLDRLGATVEAFLPGYEGPRDSETPLPLPYDRLLVTWRLSEPAAVPDCDDVDPVWAVAPGRDGGPVLDHAWSAADAALVAVPGAISALRRDEPALASTWQHAVGGALQQALAAGWHVGWDSVGAYRLTPPAQSNARRLPAD